MKVLVTGAAGFIGAHVVRHLIASGHETYALVRPGSQTRRIDDVRDHITVIEADLGDATRTASLLREVGPHTMVHLAWYAEPGRYRHALAENVAALEASAALLLAAAQSGCRRVVLGGTCLENADRSGRTIYDAAKAALHALSEGFAPTGMSAACGHVFYLYGPWEDERRVIPTVIRSLLSGDPIPTTTGLQQRDYLHVSDVASAFGTLVESSLTGGIDISSGSLVTLRDVLLTIGEEIERPELLRIGELGPAGDDGFGSAGDPRPLMGLGWKPRYDLRAGIRETITWWNARQEARS